MPPRSSTISRPSINLTHQLQKYSQLTQKYKQLQSQFNLFKQISNRQLKDMTYLYNTQTHRLAKIIQKNQKQLPKNVKLEEIKTETQYKKKSLAVLHKLVKTVQNVQKITQKLNKVGKKQITQTHFQSQQQKTQQPKSTVSFLHKSINTYIPSDDCPQINFKEKRQTDTKYESKKKQQKISKALSNVRRSIQLQNIHLNKFKKRLM